MRLGFALVVLLVSSCSLGFLGVGVVACGGAQFTAGPASDDGGNGGGTSVDGGGGEAAAGPFCTPDSGYDLCSDFDQAPLPEAWSNDSTAGGATGAEDNTASTSPPNSFLATTPPLTSLDGGAAHAILTALSLPKGQTNIAFDLRIDELDFPTGADPLASVIALAYTQGTGYVLALEFHPPVGDGSPFVAALLESSLTVGSTTPTLKVTDLPGALTTVGVWYHVTIVFSVDSSSTPGAVPATLTVTSGTPPVTTTKPVTLSPPIGTTGGARSLSIGAEATAAVGQSKLRFDNVTYSHLLH